VLDLYASIIEKNSPEFSGVDKKVTVNIGALHVIARREAFSQLIEIGVRAARGGIRVYHAPRTEGISGTIVARKAQPAVRTDDTSMCFDYYL